MDPIKAARQALLEAKTAFDANPADPKLLEELEAKGVALKDAIEAGNRAGAAMKAAELAFDGDVQDAEVKRSRFGLATDFIESPEYKNFLANGGGAGASNTERQVALPQVKLGSYADVVEQKAALATPMAHLAPVRAPMVDQLVRPELSLMDLIDTGRVDSNSLQYVQVTAIQRNAALQPENTGNDATDTLKPISDLSTNIETANVFGYADGYVVTTQLLSDASAFATFMDNELRYSLRRIQEEYLLNGTGANGQPRGILNTSGLQGLTYQGDAAKYTNLVERVRTGIRKIREVGGRTQAILLSPEDNEAIDLLKDANGNYIFGGPANVGAQTLWGVPRVVSEKLDPGQVLMGDFKQVAYLDREGVSIEAFNQHKDFAQRNLVYVRAEARGLQVIWRPAHLLLLEEA